MKAMSKIKIGVFGSCPSRDIFNSSINENYKDYFKINLSYVNNSIISTMQEKVPYDPESIKIEPDNKDNQSHTSFIEKDLDKLFFDRLDKADIDYLLIDNGLEVKWGLVNFDKYIFLKYPRLDKTNFYNNLENKRFITIQNNTDEFFKLFTKSYDAFFEKMQREYPNITIILNPVRERYRVLTKDNKIIVNEDFKNRTDNNYLPMLDGYMARKYDIEILSYDNNTLLDQNHKWGIGPKHYTKEYYQDYTQQLIEIAQRNDKLGQINPQLNENIRKDRLKNHIYKVETDLKIKHEQLENEKILKENRKLVEDNNNCHDKIKLFDQKQEELEHQLMKLKEDKLSVDTTELDNLQKSYDTLLSTKDKLEQTNNELKEKNQELHDKIEEIYSTTSWKITSPLRKLKGR